ncbi:SDR family NAD(P)-dependent oxidoreductase [Plantibacter sp. VKM Ac-2880]|uniref:SDR family NAD(P)-dependent oxidoreductase n=1 Tax=Plantibacter sp. VKM Ac-2880 TaxID=2783827 RepID=UPI00189026F7|nr:SDR family NAD(P)-dependent oxidoreductase [Plantibacter sp. VKM Ac-2880]MBF4567831.1 SDR family NAD(P)-dependent oxidoreductase [Plantibacter sp. VKM Ac-2880]
MTDRHPVAEQVIVITGASSGIGRGTALRLAQLGANVVVAARRGDVLDGLVGEITAAGGTALAVPVDVSRPDHVLALRAAATDRFGRIDVWINNAGIGALGHFWDVPVEDHLRTVDVNLSGLILGAHVALRLFREQGRGTVVNVGSVDSEVPLAYQAVYAATKAAVLSLSRSLNEELRLAGLTDIRVGTVLPWAVDTPWWTHAANYTGKAPRMAALDDPSVVIDALVAACSDPKEHQTAGMKARTAAISHQLMPDVTKRVSAKVIDGELARASAARPTTGTIHVPGPAGITVDGGVRERMRSEEPADPDPRSPAA